MKYVAETIGTFTLVFFGVGSAVLAGAGFLRMSSATAAQPAPV